MREELGKEGKETQGGKDEGKGKKKVERRVGGWGRVIRRYWLILMSG